MNNTNYNLAAQVVNDFNCIHSEGMTYLMAELADGTTHSLHRWFSDEPENSVTPHDMECYVGAGYFLDYVQHVVRNESSNTYAEVYCPPFSFVEFPKYVSGHSKAMSDDFESFDELFGDDEW